MNAVRVHPKEAYIFSIISGFYEKHRRSVTLKIFLHLRSKVYKYELSFFPT